MREEQKGIKVLHVDDEPDFLASTKAFLERENREFSINTAISAEGGIKLLKGGKYDVVVADYQMPVMDGLKLLQTLRESGNTIPFIMFTGKGREEVAIEALNRGANGYLQKGVDITSMYGTLAQLIRAEVKKKRAEEALKDSERRYRLLAENAKDAIWTVDMNMQPTYMSPSITQLLGYSVEDAMAKRMEEVYAPASYELAMKILAEELAIENMEHKDLSRSRMVELELYRKDGFIVTVEGKFSFLRDPDGRPVEILAIVRDITERKKEEEERERLLKELAAKNRELDRFTYTVSHDLQSPLVTIQGFTDMVQTDLAQNELENAKNNLKFIDKAATKMEKLLSNTLELSRIGRITNPPEDVSFGEIVDNALAQTAGEINSNNIEVSVAEDFPTVHVDRTRIDEVLVNLIGNSINYRGEEPHPKIEIGYRIDNGERVFFVQDNGIGIDKSEHEKVFELFYQVDTSGKGTGAGFAIVKRIIEVHNGRIWIESEKGKGCTVCFTLPVQ